MTMDSLIKQTKIYFLGSFVFVLLILFILLSLPLYLYRWILTKFVAPLIGGNLRKAVNISSQGFAAEFLKPPNTPTRLAVCLPAIVEAHIPAHVLCEEIEEKVFNAKDAQGNLKYPEAKQYPESWMGVMFWKEDTNFSLSNHIKVHELKENGTNLESEKFFMELAEKLLNEPFPRKRSPWEIHFVHNFKNPRTSDGINGTLVFIRFQHAMGDGFSFANLIRDNFIKSKPTLPKVSMANKKESKSEFNLFSIFKLTKSIVYELGRFSSFHLLKRTRYHIPDEKKKWHQYFGRAPSIPVEKIKLIKNTFEVSFASVLISTFTTALGKMLLKLEKGSNINEDNLPETFLLGIILPKGNHPKHLTNHFTIGTCETSFSMENNAVERLQELRMGKLGNSGAAKLFPLFINIFSGHLAKVAGLSMKNRILGAGLSSFSAVGLEPTWNGHKCCVLDAPVGGVEGVCGVACCVFSFDDMLQLSATAEAGVMTRENLNELLKTVYDEIENLYKIAIKLEIKETNGNQNM